METQTNASGQTVKMKETKKAAGLLYVGSMFMGMTAGWYTGNFSTGMFAGMGVGFVLMAVVYISQAAKK